MAPNATSPKPDIIQSIQLFETIFHGVTFQSDFTVLKIPTARAELTPWLYRQPLAQFIERDVSLLLIQRKNQRLMRLDPPRPLIAALWFGGIAACPALLIPPPHRRRWRYLLAPCVEQPARNLVPFDRRAYRSARAESIAQHLELLTDRPISPAGNACRHLDPTGHTTARMTSRSLVTQIQHQQTPDQRGANNATRTSHARRTSDRAYG